MLCSARFRLVRWIANGLCLLAAVTFVAVLLMNRVNPRWLVLQYSGSELIAERRLSHKFKEDTVGWMILVPAILLPPLHILLVELYYDDGELQQRTSSKTSTLTWMRMGKTKNSDANTNVRLGWTGVY